MLFDSINLWPYSAWITLQSARVPDEEAAIVDLELFPKVPAPVYIASSLHSSYSNQRTRNQFRPRNATKGTSSYQLRQYAEATLGGGSLRKIVKLPEGEDENEWLAVNSTLRHWCIAIHGKHIN